MYKFLGRFLILSLLTGTFAASGQIDPEKRQLLQFGYNQPLVGRSPVSGYAFYFRNDPGFMRTNITLRLALAPVYLDTELGFKGAISPRTDLAIGLSGGGFADSYFEYRRGNWNKQESFTGHGGEVSASIYHLFNPTQRIPLSGIFRLAPHYSLYERDSDTAAGFVLPNDHSSMNLRTGLRLGGREPTIFPQLALELSAWYEGQYRLDDGHYGFAGDRKLEDFSHLIWGRALFIYTLPELKHNFGISFTTGTSIDADRFSAYRLGGSLPLASEFPLTLPGYYYQELSARNFQLLAGQYTLPLDPKQNWNLTFTAAQAHVSYLEGLQQPNKWHSGIGLGLGYRSKSGMFQFVGGYSYGFEAQRNGTRGGQSIGVLCQIDLEAHHRPAAVEPIDSPLKSRGLFKIFGE
ncbi:MAG: hypothetical protein JWM68_5529 [Verrucomicrobiales bacterium]|nr:hypothetical protein [Verrucomicrobiales bacterium]